MSLIRKEPEKAVVGLFAVVEERHCAVEEDIFETREQAEEHAAERDSHYLTMRHRVYQLVRVGT